MNYHRTVKIIKRLRKSRSLWSRNLFKIRKGCWAESLWTLHRLLSGGEISILINRSSKTRLINRISLRRRRTVGFINWIIRCDQAWVESMEKFSGHSATTANLWSRRALEFGVRRVTGAPLQMMQYLIPTLMTQNTDTRAIKSQLRIAVLMNHSSLTIN